MTLNFGSSGLYPQVLGLQMCTTTLVVEGWTRGFVYSGQAFLTSHLSNVSIVIKHMIKATCKRKCDLVCMLSEGQSMMVVQEMVAGMAESSHPGLQGGGGENNTVGVVLVS